MGFPPRYTRLALSFQPIFLTLPLSLTLSLPLPRYSVFSSPVLLAPLRVDVHTLRQGRQAFVAREKLFYFRVEFRTLDCSRLLFVKRFALITCYQAIQSKNRSFCMHRGYRRIAVALLGGFFVSSFEGETIRRLLSSLTNRCAVFSRRGKIRGSSVLAMHISKG